MVNALGMMLALAGAAWYGIVELGQGEDDKKKRRESRESARNASE